MKTELGRDALLAFGGMVIAAVLTNLNSIIATFKTSKLKAAEIASKAQADLIDDGSEIRKEYRQLWLDTQTHNERLEIALGRQTIRNTQLEELLRKKGIKIPPFYSDLPPGPPAA